MRQNTKKDIDIDFTAGRIKIYICTLMESEFKAT